MDFPLLRWLSQRFALTQDMAEPADIVANVEEGMSFKGTNLWVLMFAILVASVGLNVNSTAVIIGAMLISPLMGPILGVGLSVGLYDSDVFRQGMQQLAYTHEVRQYEFWRRQRWKWSCSLGPRLSSGFVSRA